MADSRLGPDDKTSAVDFLPLVGAEVVLDVSKGESVKVAVTVECVEVVCENPFGELCEENSDISLAIRFDGPLALRYHCTRPADFIDDAADMQFELEAHTSRLGGAWRGPTGTPPGAAAQQKHPAAVRCGVRTSHYCCGRAVPPDRVPAATGRAVGGVAGGRPRAP